MSESMKIEVTEQTGIKSAGYNLSFEDVVTVPAVHGKRWTALGWAKCAKTGECGERIPGSRVLNEDGSLGPATKVIEPDDFKTDSSGTKA